MVAVSSGLPPLGLVVVFCVALFYSANIRCCNVFAKLFYEKITMLYIIFDLFYMVTPYFLYTCA